MSTAERVRLPDDCTVGYIVEGLLGARLRHSPLFHSHLENLRRLPPHSVLQQVGWPPGASAGVGGPGQEAVPAERARGRVGSGQEGPGGVGHCFLWGLTCKGQSLLSLVTAVGLQAVVWVVMGVTGQVPGTVNGLGQRTPAILQPHRSARHSSVLSDLLPRPGAKRPLLPRP